MTHLPPYGAPPPYRSSPPPPPGYGSVRPAGVTTGAVLAIVGAAGALAVLVLGWIGVLVEATDPATGWLWGTGEIMVVSSILLVLCGLSVAAVVTAALSLGRRNGARVTLVVLAGVAIAVELFLVIAAVLALAEPETAVAGASGDTNEHEGAAAVLVGAVVWLGLTTGSLCCLVGRRARQWYGRKQAGPAGVPPGPPFA